AMASAAAPAAASGPSWTLLALACGVSAVLGSVAGYVAHDAVSAPSVSAPQPSSATAVIDGQTAEEPLPVVDAPATPAAVDPPAIDGADEVPAADSTRSGEPRPSANPRRGDASVAGVTRDESEPATAPVTEDVAGNAPTEAAARDEALADENALITRAQSALARGRAAEALTALREHQRRFPGGRFVEEREAMTIQAMARTGQVDAARTRAERFYARYPNSLLTRAVRAAVREP
ncbi:MAG: outer membrane protein assembly factor BamD, partial [Myxococcales bacterium]|nr:outer membrane protein assembly factor BamD [Myxococcales bacterium]